MKLPAFYLLDMISKNIYDPYARHFAAFVVPLFLETYAEVDPPTRSKMEELVLTWRTGSPAGKELFGVSSQVSIERGIWGDGAASSSVRFYAKRKPRKTKAAIQSTSFRGSTQITKSQVLSELEFILGQKERARQANPYDPVNQQHIGVLQQVSYISVFFDSALIAIDSFGSLLKLASPSKSYSKSLVNCESSVKAQALPHHLPLRLPSGQSKPASLLPTSHTLRRRRHHHLQI